MQVISEQNMREKRDLERVQRKLDKIAQRQKDAGKNMENITEHYIRKCLYIYRFISLFESCYLIFILKDPKYSFSGISAKIDWLCKSLP